MDTTCAAGPPLLRECHGLGGCRTGDAKVTTGYRFPPQTSFTRQVRSGTGGRTGERELLAARYRRAIGIAAARLRALSSENRPGTGPGYWPTGSPAALPAPRRASRP
ncbi:macro domain-containing protein [Candidatus Accumulibacter sp. ACC007]|uniref:macro domain-containing protein n=1 Tax=Candidatus Accumulibacter sp. ACC007 TaxID=2823333 RepID=UPI0034250E43